MINLWWWAVRSGFHLLYNQLAFAYDTVSKVVSLGAWRCWQRSALKHLNVLPGTVVLELAHGTGDLQIDLKEAGYHAVGYDLSPQMGRIAQAKLQRLGFSAVLVRGRAEQLPFARGQFPVVVTTFPTDFIVADAVLSEVYRILTERGKLVIVSSGMLCGGGVIRSFLEWLYRVTGQRSNASGGTLMEKVLMKFGTHGFETELSSEPCPRSVAQVIIARKKV